MNKKFIYLDFNLDVNKEYKVNSMKTTCNDVLCLAFCLL